MTTIHFQGSGFDEFSAMLERFGERVQNPEPAFEKMADHQANVWRREFDSQGASMSEGRWSALSPDYGAWKAKNYPGKGILERSGDLKDSLTSRPFGVEAINDHQMIIGTAVDYAGYHQRGEGRLPQRKLVGDQRREDIKEFTKIMHEHIIEMR